MGVFHVEIAKKPPVYFIIMQSVFFPDTNLSLRYDIKGCLAGRYQTPGVLGDNQEVYKDKNFEELVRERERVENEKWTKWRKEQRLREKRLKEEQELRD